MAPKSPTPALLTSTSIRPADLMTSAVQLPLNRLVGGHVELQHGDPGTGAAATVP